MLCFLAVQGYYLRENTNCVIDEVFKKEHEIIITEHKKIKVKENIELFKSTTCPTDDEIKYINNKERKSKNDRIKLKLFEMKQQGISIHGKSDAEIIKIIDNIGNSKFDYYTKDINNDNINNFVLKNLIQ